MEQYIKALQAWLTRLGVPADLAPLVPFLVVVLGIAVVVAVVALVLVRTKAVRPRTMAFWLFVSPWIFGFLTFTLFPMAFSLGLSLMRWDVVSPAEFVGFDNYARAVVDPLVWRALQVTFYYVLLTVPASVVLAFSIGLILNRPVRGMSFIRTAWYLPVLVAGVPQVTLMIALFAPRNGVINSALRLVGIEGPGWLYDPSWAVPTVALMSLWTVGGTMLIYLAGLKDIPRDLYEAAALDGAGPVRLTWHITLPQMSPIILFNLLTGLIAGFQIFAQGYVATGGAPAGAIGRDNSLLFFVYYLYRVSFSQFQFGYGSALAWVLFAIIVGITILTFRFSSPFVFYEGAAERVRRRLRSKDLVARASR